MKNETQEQIEREKISDLTKKLIQNPKNKYALVEMFDLTGDKDYLLKAIEIVNPSNILYPQSHPMGGTNFGYMSSEEAGYLAKKKGEPKLAAKYFREAISRLEVYHERANRESGMWERKFRGWDSSDDETLKRYWGEVINLEGNE